MWYPGMEINNQLRQLVLALTDDPAFKAEIAKHVRIEMDNERKKYNGTVQSYDALTSGNVNLQAKMAASGYDIYGKTYMRNNKNTTNDNTYKKMKNRIKYGRSPENGYQNHGDITIA